MYQSHDMLVCTPTCCNQGAIYQQCALHNLRAGKINIFLHFDQHYFTDYSDIKEFNFLLIIQLKFL